jgi:hypothetical protein
MLRTVAPARHQNVPISATGIKAASDLLESAISSSDDGRYSARGIHRNEKPQTAIGLQWRVRCASGGLDLPHILPDQLTCSVNNVPPALGIRHGLRIKVTSAVLAHQCSTGAFLGWHSSCCAETARLGDARCYSDAARSGTCCAVPRPVMPGFETSGVLAVRRAMPAQLRAPEATAVTHSSMAGHDGCRHCSKCKREL